MAKLHAKAREALPSSSFAAPAQKKLPLTDKTHIIQASRMVDRTQGINKTAAKARINTARKAHGMKPLKG